MIQREGAFERQAKAESMPAAVGLKQLNAVGKTVGSAFACAIAVLADVVVDIVENEQHRCADFQSLDAFLNQSLCKRADKAKDVCGFLSLYDKQARTGIVVELVDDILNGFAGCGRNVLGVGLKYRGDFGLEIVQRFACRLTARVTAEFLHHVQQVLGVFLAESLAPVRLGDAVHEFVDVLFRFLFCAVKHVHANVVDELIDRLLVGPIYRDFVGAHPCGNRVAEIVATFLEHGRKDHHVEEVEHGTLVHRAVGDVPHRGENAGRHELVVESEYACMLVLRKQGRKRQCPRVVDVQVHDMDVLLHLLQQRGDEIVRHRGACARTGADHGAVAAEQ